MSHCLTQPEEIDHILMSMADDDTEVDAPIPDGVQSGGAIRGVGREEFAMAPGFSSGAMQKPAHGLSGP